MITTKQQLKEYLKTEKKLYFPGGAKDTVESIVMSENSAVLWKYQKLLRKTEYHHNRKSGVSKLFYGFFRRKKNILGRKLGIEIWDNTFDEGLLIAHPGNIVINGMARVGKNCILHGSNCIGNRGIDLGAPVIGDNVRIGVGAKIIGNVTLADNITVAAGAVVISSFLDKGVVIAGVPARVVKSSEE